MESLSAALYIPAHVRNHNFARATAHQIGEFLNNLRNGLVLRGTKGTKSVLLFPLEGVYVQTTKGRFVTTASTLVSPPKLSVGDFERLV